MTTLFSKILLWFLATAVVMIGGFVVVTAMISSSARQAQMPFAMLLAFQAGEAARTYEADGAPGLAVMLARFSRQGRVDPVLTDASGLDLLTGRDYSRLVDRLRDVDRPVFYNGRLVLARQTEDARFWYLLFVPQRRLFWFLRVQHLWIAGLALLLCYLLAMHLTSPVRQLQRAVERFGRGDLSARVEMIRRRDELGQLAQTFNRMADRIETLLAAERRLLGDISHELRSPLARLSVAVELARSGENRDQALNRIQKEADRLNELVGELLQVTRVEGDASQMRRETVRFDELVAEVVDDSSIEARARGCELKLQASPVTLQGDPELLRRAVENVVRNAIRYEPHGSAVEVSVGSKDSTASVEVRDHGPGVPPEALPRIFDPFFRVEADRNRSSGGAGLGLAIARRAVDLHKGSVRAENASPGLRVRIELPLVV